MKKLKLGIVERLLLRMVIIENTPERGNSQITFIPLDDAYAKIDLTQNELKKYAIKDTKDANGNPQVSWNEAGTKYFKEISFTELEVAALQLVFKLSDEKDNTPKGLLTIIKQFSKK